MRKVSRFNMPSGSRTGLFGLAAWLGMAKAYPGLFIAVLAVGLAAAASVADLSQAVRAATGTCNIKGNISIPSRERIYHVPGQEYYTVTRISPQYGERWFCSEAEARQAGWRRSRV